MSDLQIIIYTACATLIGGIILLILSELIKSSIVSPVQKLREQIPITLGKVDFHCNMLTNFFPVKPSDDERSTIRSIMKDLREAATDLNAKYKMIPFRKFLSLLRFVPSPDEIDVAYRGLIYLHNSILYEGRREHIVNLIDVNQNAIDRVHAALTHKEIPPMTKPKEKS